MLTQRGEHRAYVCAEEKGIFTREVTFNVHCHGLPTIAVGTLHGTASNVRHAYCVDEGG